MNYQQYLDSPVWMFLRKQRLAMDNHECVLCGGPADQVHHRRYPERLGDETVIDLVSLCGECHAKFHGMNGEMIRMPPPAPLTDDMLSIRNQISMADGSGEEEKAARLFAEYCYMRRGQLVGV